MSRPLAIVGLHHLSFAVANADLSADFYCDVLGFTRLDRPPFSFRGAWLYNYGVQIHIIEREQSPHSTGKIDTRGNHIAFRVAELAAVRETLQEHNITFHEQTNAGGAEQIFFTDPDGHHIEIGAYADPSIGYEE